MTEETEQHKMALEWVNDAGEELWSCPHCGRKFRIHLDREKARITVDVVVPGDEMVQHYGSKGGLQVFKTEIVQAATDTDGSEELRDAVDDALSHLDLDELLGSEE